MLGSIGTAVYRAEIASLAARVPLPPAAFESARSTLGGAVEVAKTLPARIGAELVEAAQAAFTQGMQFSSRFSAVMMLALALLAAVMLRRSGSRIES